MKRYATVAIVLDTQHKDVENKLLKLRITHNRIPRLFSIGDDTIRLTKEQFNNPRKIATQDAMVVANKALRIAEEIIQELGKDFTFAAFKEKYDSRYLLRENTSTSLDSLLTEYFNDSKHQCKYKTIKSYETSVNWVKRYKRNATLSSITPEFVEGLISFMRQEHQKAYGKDMSENTLRINLRQLRALYFFAISKGYINNQKNPFALPNLGSISRQKGALTTEELLMVLDYKPKDKKEEFGKDFFLLSFYFFGANLGDILLLRNSNIHNGTVSFFRRKTQNSPNAKPVEFDLTTDAEILFNKYGRISEDAPNELILPLLSNYTSEEEKLENRIKYVIKKVNAGLKSICDALGLRTITTYNARHTMATVLRDKNMTAEQIQKLLGHSSVTTTQIYLDSLSKDVRSKSKTILEELGKKR